MNTKNLVLGGAFALLMMAVPMRGNAATFVSPTQAHEVSTARIHETAYYGHSYMPCRDPHFRRHHRWLCW
jgi:hypothetical protein